MCFQAPSTAIYAEMNDDYVKKPLDVIKKRCSGELRAGNGGAECVKAVNDAFLEYLRRGGTIESIPVLTREAWASDRLSVNSLVRFRGMVQDTLDAEFFVGVHKVRDSGEHIPTLFQDTVQLGPGLQLDDLVPHETMERRRVICVPIPGESPWVMGPHVADPVPYQGMDAGSSPAQRPKRGFGEVDEEGGSSGRSSQGEGTKLMKEEEGGSASMMDTSDGPHAKRTPSSQLECTLAYFYSSGGEASEPKLNEAVDLVGVLSFDPVLADPSASRQGPGAPAEQQQQQQQQDLGFGEDGSEDLPLSLVPRLHVVCWSKAGRLFAPAAPFDLTGPQPLPMGLDSAGGMEEAREAVLSYLCDSVGGDRVAAEYLLLGLISRVAARTTGNVVGHLPLNFTSPQMTSLAPSLKQTVQDIAARCVALDVTIPSLEAGRWFPHKDYNTNRLVSAPLQVTPGTILLVDETDLQEGQLGPTGLANLGVLRQLADLMVVPYDFDFYKLDFEADSPFLVLSKTRTILGGAVICEVPVETPSSTGGDEDSMAITTSGRSSLPEETLERLRLYLAAVSELKVQMNDDIARQAEADFVAARAAGTDKSLSQHDLSRWLTLARLICASYGQSRIDAAKHWVRMRTLEGVRRARMLRGAGDSGAEGTTSTGDSGNMGAASHAVSSTGTICQ